MKLSRDLKLSIKVLLAWVIVFSVTVYYLRPTTIKQNDSKAPSQSWLHKLKNTVDMGQEYVKSSYDYGKSFQKPSPPKEKTPPVKIAAEKVEPAVVEIVADPVVLPATAPENPWSYTVGSTCAAASVAWAVETEHAVSNMGFWNTMSRFDTDRLRKEWKGYMSRLKPRKPTGQRGIIYTSYSSVLEYTISSIRLLRKYGCKLPIEIWYFGTEFSGVDLSRIRSLKDVTPRNVKDYLPNNELRKAQDKMFEIKGAAMIYTNFDQFLYLDSDNMPVRDPTFLFETEAFKATGSLFWKDFWKTAINNPIWDVMGIGCEDEYEQESGQLVIDKSYDMTWKALNLAFYMQKRREIYFRLLMGDKDTFRFAWRAMGAPFHMISSHLAAVGTMRPQFCGHTMVQFSPHTKPLTEMDNATTKRTDLLFMHINLLKYTSYPQGQTFTTLQTFEHPIVKNQIGKIYTLTGGLCTKFDEAVKEEMNPVVEIDFKTLAPNFERDYYQALYT